MKEPLVQLDGNIISIKVPLSMKHHHGRKLIMLPKNIRITAPQGKPDEAMVKALARAWMWQKYLDNGKYSSLEDLAEKSKINASYVSRILRLNLLSPNIKSAILNGMQPRTFNLQGMMAPFPEFWEEQFKHFGFTD
ncbi:MAG: hypothetical protein IPP74_12620 [Alphaproteobacteria bacterium]|nr:hypothetical protein [Alphaproteobacteria bacterium]